MYNKMFGEILILGLKRYIIFCLLKLLFIVTGKPIVNTLLKRSYYKLSAFLVECTFLYRAHMQKYLKLHILTVIFGKIVKIEVLPATGLMLHSVSVQEAGIYKKSGPKPIKYGMYCICNTQTGF